MTDVAPIETTPAAAPPKRRMVRVKLTRNYRPSGDFETVGHHREAVFVKNVAGKEVEVEPAAFIEGEAAPPPQAGVGFETKIWAGTVIRLTTDEAKSVRANGIGEVEVDD